MNKIYAFTDGSYIPAMCKSNKRNVDIGSASFIFNKDKKEWSKTSPLTPCYGSTHAEMAAILNVIKAIVKHHDGHTLEQTAIKVHTDCTNCIQFLSSKAVPSKSPKPQKQILAELAMKIQSYIEVYALDVEFKHVKAHKRKNERTVTEEYNELCNKRARHSARTQRKVGSKKKLYVNDITV